MDMEENECKYMEIKNIYITNKIIYPFLYMYFSICYTLKLCI